MSDYRIYKGHKGVINGYRARKGIGKRLKSRFFRRVGRRLCRQGVDE